MDILDRRPPHHQAWPLRPTCGVLGASWAWFLPQPCAKAARLAVGRQLGLFRVSEGVTRAVDLTLFEIVESARRFPVSGLFLEAALTGRTVDLAVREQSDTGWAHPARLDRHGLSLPHERPGTVETQPVPGGTNYAIVARLQLQHFAGDAVIPVQKAHATP
nr:hypothetical protein [Streptomyces chartreusis]